MAKKYENIDRRDELVKILDIDLDWKMHQVSDGQRKRVQIMLGLLKPFKFLIIDEFLNELDVVIRDRFFKYLTKECSREMELSFMQLMFLMIYTIGQIK